MDWEILGSVADIAAAVAVVISLVYLARQLRHNAVASDSAAVIAYGAASAAISTTLAQDAELNKLFWAYAAGEDMPEEDARRAHSIFFLYINVSEQAFDLYRSGALSEEKWQGRYQQLKWFVNQPGFHKFWQEYSELNAASWKKMIEEAMGDN